jgi:two-component system sensor histidine kinase YesM
MKIFLAMILATALPLSITAGIIFYQVSRSIEADEEFAHIRIEEDLKGRINDFFDSLNEIAYQIYSYQDLTDAIPFNRQYLVESFNYDIIRDIEQFFLSVYYQSRLKEIMGMQLLRNNGELLNDFYPLVRPQFDQKYYDSLVDQARFNLYKPKVQFHYNSLYGEPVIQFLYPVRYRGKPSGLLVIDMKEKEFREQVEHYNVLYRGKISLTNPSGQTAYDTDPNQAGKVFADASSLDRTVLIETSIKAKGWKLNYSYQIDPKKILYRNLTIIIIAMSGVLAIILSLGLSINLTKPIVQLHRKMKLIQVGNYNARVEVRTRDEIGFLGNQFNQMAETIQQLVEHDLKLRLMNKDTQIKALQAQISPHFLFNTLQMMAGIAEVNNVPDMKWIIQSLSDMYRYNMNIDNEWVQLRDEIKHIRNYLVIINKRYNGTIRFHLSIETAAYDWRIPKLILQPIVENAVEHGLIPRMSNRKLLKIAVQSDRKNGNLIIRVLDNGVGMDDTDMLDLDTRLRESVKHQDEEHSIGLTNVHTRIRLICGEPYGIRLTSRKEKGTCVTFTLPLKEEAIK